VCGHIFELIFFFLIPLYLSGSPLMCLFESHLNVTTDIAGGDIVVVCCCVVDIILRDVPFVPFILGVEILFWFKPEN